MGCNGQSKIHEEFLPEAYVINLMGLDPKDPKDQNHMKELRNGGCTNNCVTGNL